MVKTHIVLAGLVALAGMAAPAAAQQPKPITKVNSISATATVQAIDSTARKVTLRNDKGEEDTFIIGPEMKRFDELKVGDKVKMTYYESLVLQVRKPGEKTNVAGVDAALTRAKSEMPGATLAAQEKMSVTVKAIDTKLPSITVTTDDGRTVTRKVENKKNLEGVKVGDKIDLTYTESIIMDVQRVAS
jgi:Cu/Ag efflux protein CusF